MTEILIPETASTSRAIPGKSFRRVFGLAGIIALAAIAGGGCKKSTGIQVETQQVTRRSIVQTVIATGIIDPETQVKVSPEVSGEIVYLGVQEGDIVHKGQVIVRINPLTINAQRDQIQAAISAAESRTAQAQATLIRAKADFGRIEQLKGKQLATQQEYDNSQAQVKIAEAELSAARFQVDQERATLRQTMVSLGKTTIVAPLSGTVTKLNSKLGEKVVGAIQMSGTEIMTIADLSVIETVVDVSENDVVQVKLGDSADIEVDAIPNQKFRAFVSRIANSPTKSGIGTQEQATNFQVRLRFSLSDPRFRPGMTTTATIQTESKENVLTVPIQSVTTRKKDEAKGAKADADAKDEVKSVRDKAQKDEKPEPVVFIKQGDSVVTRKVATGIRDDQYIEILNGLSGSETVVSGSYKAITKDLEQGSKITVTDPRRKGAGTDKK